MKQKYVKSVIAAGISICISLPSVALEFANVTGSDLKTSGTIKLSKINPKTESCKESTSNIYMNLKFLYAKGATSLDVVSKNFSDLALLNQMHAQFEAETGSPAAIKLSKSLVGKITQDQIFSTYDVYSKTSINLIVITTSKNVKAKCTETRRTQSWTRECVTDTNYKDGGSHFYSNSFSVNCSVAQDESIKCVYEQYSSVKPYCSFIIDKYGMELALNGVYRTGHVFTAIAEHSLSDNAKQTAMQSYQGFQTSVLENKLDKFFKDNEERISEKSKLELTL